MSFPSLCSPTLNHLNVNVVDPDGPDMLPDSRPLTPDSQLTSSLHRATTTIDELTRTLTSVSRFSSPEPDNVTTCCCGREDCEASRAWAEIKSKLESRLVLSAGTLLHFSYGNCC